MLAEELRKAGVPAQTGNDGFGIGMVGPTIIVWGTEEQKRHFLPCIISRSVVSGYSSPTPFGPGQCQDWAVLDGDEW